MSTGKAIVMSLVCGTIIMTKILQDSDTSYVLTSAFELHHDTSPEGVEIYYFTRYLPFNDDGTVLIHKTAVAALSLVSDKYQLLYEKKVATYELMKERISDPDETEVMEASDDGSNDEESDDSDEDDDDYDPSEASPFRGPRTLH